MSSAPPPNQLSTEIPVCPRHPDTAAYTRCQRCGRPACTRCQIPASVGFQCVDCVAAEQKANAIPAQRSSLGITATPGPPLVTYAIIAICVIVWVMEKASTSFFNHVAFYGVLAKDEPWRYVTSGFAHDTNQLLHLPLNMYVLYYMGQYLEPLIGRVRFAVLYLLSVLGGTVLFQVMTAPSGITDVDTSGWASPLIGASGGIFGLFLAVLVLNRHLGREVNSMIGLIVVNAVLGFVVPGVAWQAHLGGAIIGALGAALIYALRRRPAAAQYAALGVVALALVAIAYADFAIVDLPPIRWSYA